MGIFYSRAARKRDRAMAKLLDEQRRQLRSERQKRERDEGVEAAGDSILRQPTVRDALAAIQRNRERGRRG